MSDYEDFWQKNGLDYIVPPNTDNPEGFDVGEVLRGMIHGNVLEIGCGTGRIAKYFQSFEYTGVDINNNALNVARAALPFHDFRLHNLGEDYPACETALLYTVALHIPDDIIAEELSKIGSGADRVIIAEIMNPDHRKNRSKDGAYDISNHRSIEDYRNLMRASCGMSLKSLINRPYKHYQGEHISFAEFT